MKLNKKDVDALIAATRNYYKKGDILLLSPLVLEQVVFDYYESNLIKSLTKHAELTNKTNQQIYDCLAVMGYEVAEE